MQKNYMQSIASFAIAIPLLVTLVVIIIIQTVKSSLVGDFPEKQSKYTQELQLNKQLAIVEKENAAKKENLAQWTTLMTGDAFTKVNENLLSSVKQSNKTGTLHVMEKSRSNSRIQGVNAPHSACDFVLQGTFAELQRSLTQLECRMPNLMVNNMSLKPQASGKLLEFKINYTVWEQ